MTRKEIRSFIGARSLWFGYFFLAHVLQLRQGDQYVQSYVHVREIEPKVAGECLGNSTKGAFFEITNSYFATDDPQETRLLIYASAYKLTIQTGLNISRLRGNLRQLLPSSNRFQ